MSTFFFPGFYHLKNCSARVLGWLCTLSTVPVNECQLIFFFFPVTQHGHPDGGVSTMHAEHLRGYSLPSADLDGGNGWSSSVLPDCLTLLLLCKYISKILHVAEPL